MTGLQELDLRDSIHNLLKPYFLRVKKNAAACDQACTDAAQELTTVVLRPFLTKETKTSPTTGEETNKPK